MADKVPLPPTPTHPGLCNARPDVDQTLYNPMAPPCIWKRGHKGRHSWETWQWKIGGFQPRKRSRAIKP